MNTNLSIINVNKLDIKSDHLYIKLNYIFILEICSYIYICNKYK